MVAVWVGEKISQSNSHPRSDSCAASNRRQTVDDSAPYAAQPLRKPMKGKRDTSMVTAPRDKWVILERYPDGDGGPKRFVGRWNEEKFRWEDQDGVFRSRVHSWHPFPANAGGHPTGATE
jgi:hypothetical protein